MSHCICHELSISPIELLYAPRTLQSHQVHALLRCFARKQHQFGCPVHDSSIPALLSVALDRYTYALAGLEVNLLGVSVLFIALHAHERGAFVFCSGVLSSIRLTISRILEVEL